MRRRPRLSVAGGPPTRERARDRRHPARRDRRRHHQHRGGVGNADHVPDPARVRRPAGHGQRQQHGRAGARVVSGAVGYRARARRTAAAGCCDSASASLVGGRAGAVLLLCCRRRRSTRSCRRWSGSGCCSWSSARPSHAGSRPGRRARGRRSTAAPWVWPAGAPGRRVRRLLRRGPGRAARGDPRDRRRRPLQRHNATKNVLALIVNAVAAVVFIVVADVDWAVAGLIAAGSIVGGQLGATVGRRLPAAVLRAVIVVVGVDALWSSCWTEACRLGRSRNSASSPGATRVSRHERVWGAVIAGTCPAAWAR